MFEPAYKIRIGAARIDSQAQPQGSSAVSIDVALDLDTPADQVSLVLGRVDGMSPAVGDDLEVELGDEDSMERIFTGKVSDVRPEITSTRVLALTEMSKLLALRVEQTYQNKTAGDIVRDLAGQAGVATDSVEAGVSFPAYVADGRHNAYQHVRLLAEKSGFEVFVNANGKLTFRSLAGTVTAHLFGYGEHLLSIHVEERPTAFGQVQVFGESPVDSQGNEAFAWLTKRFNPGQAGSGAGTRFVEDASLKTGAAAGTAASALSRRLRQRTLTGRLRALGRPQVKLDDAVRISGAPDERMNQSFRVRSVRHRLTKDEGFVTEVAFWSVE